MEAVYSQLSLQERRKIEAWWHAQVPVREMARVLNRDLTALTDHDFKMISDRHNATPKKCLGWKTPAEVFTEKMMEEANRTPYPHKQ